MGLEMGTTSESMKEIETERKTVTKNELTKCLHCVCGNQSGGVRDGHW